MPKPPRIQSPRARQLAVSATMTLLLAVSLLLALWFSTGSPRSARFSHAANQGQAAVQIGPVEFLLPAGWQPLDLPATDALGKAQLTLAHPSRPGDLLIVGLLPQTTLRSPEAAMKQAVALLLGDEAATITATTRFRQGRRVGIVQSILSPRKRPEADAYHLATFTDDGHLHALACLVQLDVHLPHRAERDMDIMATSLVLDIAHQARNNPHHPASQSDLARAGLASSKPIRPGHILMTIADPTDDAMIHLLPRGGPSGYWRVRLHGMPNALTHTPGDPLFKPIIRSLQRRLASSQTDEAPLVTLSREQVGVDGWIIRPVRSPEKVRQSDGLVRELWYILPSPTADDDDDAPADAPPPGAIIAELVAEPHTYAHASAQLTESLQTLRFHPRGPHDDWAAAQERGRAIRQTLGQTYTRRFTPGMTYDALYRDGLPVGFAIEQRRHDTQAPQPWQGRSVVFHATSPRFVHQQSWSTDDDARQFSQTTWLVHRPAEGQDARQVHHRRLELHDQTLTLLDMTPAGGNDDTAATIDDAIGDEPWQERWRQEVSSSFVAWPLLESLPVSSLEQWQADGPALVWVQFADDEPEPCWLAVQAVTPDQARALGFEARWLVRLRALADVEDTRLWTDAQGQILRVAWSDALPAQAMPVRYTTHRMDRQRILRAFEQLQPDIETWEKQWPPAAP